MGSNPAARIVSYLKHRRPLWLPLVLSSLVAVLACDEPPPEIVPAAGSFALPGACGEVVAAIDGGIYTWSQTSPATFRVDARSATGDLKWSTTLPGHSSCTGAVAQSGDLATSSLDSLFVLTQSTGDIKWRRAAPQANIATGTDGRIYVTTVAFLFAPPTLTAINATTGAVVWSETVQGGGAPYLDETVSRLYNVRRAGALSLNPSNGSVNWETPITTSDRGFDAAIAADQTLIVGIDNDFSSAIAAYNPDGTRKWFNNAPTPRNLVSPPVIGDNGLVYSAHCGTQSTACTIYAMSVATGQIVWSKDFDRIESDIVVAADRTVYFIARLSAATNYLLYGLRDGVIATEVPAKGITFHTSHPLLLHQNKLLYYVGTDEVIFTPTAGIGTAQAWPMPKHDPLRTARKPIIFLPD